MADLWLEDDPDVLRSRGSLKWAVTRTELGAWVAESDLGTAPAVSAALHDAVDRGLTGYLPPQVRAAATRACADWQQRRYGWPVATEQVRLVSDVIAALRLVLDRLVPEGPVVLPTPAYMPFVAEPARWGRTVLEVPMVPDAGGRPALDLAAIDTALAAGARVVVLVNPHNPTGRVHTADELTALAEVVQRHGARVFADEIHAPLVLGGRRHVPYASVSPAAAAHTVTATSASKGWNVAGLKCAQVILAEPDTAVWDAAGDTALGVATPGAIAAAAAYDHGESWLDELCAYLDANARALGEALAETAPRVGYSPPEGTYLAWLDLRDAPAPHRARSLEAWARHEAGVVVTDGARCGEAGRGFARLNLAMPCPLVLEAARRIGAALDR